MDFHDINPKYKINYPNNTILYVNYNIYPNKLNISNLYCIQNMYCVVNINLSSTYGANTALRDYDENGRSMNNQYLRKAANISATSISKLDKEYLCPT